MQKWFKIKIVIEITQSIETRMLGCEFRSEGVLKNILKEAFKHFKEKMNNKTLAKVQNYE
jgi:carbamoylphosphate synthase small subunit